METFLIRLDGIANDADNAYLRVNKAQLDLLDYLCDMGWDSEGYELITKENITDLTK